MRLVPGVIGFWCILNPAVIHSQAATQPDRSPVTEDVIRQSFAVPDSMKLTITGLKSSVFSGFDELTITLGEGSQATSHRFLSTKDGHYLIEGRVFDLRMSPEIVARTVDTKDQPSIGPPDAPVTVIEYADYQCPACSVSHKLLAEQLLAKFAGKIRIVYKDLPLTEIHDWAILAALASQCVYQVSPGKYAEYRSLLFERAASIQSVSVHDTLLRLVEDVQADRPRVSACLDSQSSLSRVEATRQEAQMINVTGTPTYAINGKLFSAGSSVESVVAFIEKILAAPAHSACGQGCTSPSF